MNESNVINIKDKKLTIVITIFPPDKEGIQFDPITMEHASMNDLVASLKKIDPDKYIPFVGTIDGHVYFIPGEVIARSIVCYSKVEEGV